MVRTWAVARTEWQGKEDGKDKVTLGWMGEGQL